MTSTRTQYSDAILVSLTPEKAAEAIKDRLNRAKLANDEIADWIKDRLAIEERYAHELEALSKKHTQYSNAESLGAFAGVWETVVKGAHQASTASKELVRKARNEIELPIRQFSEKSRQWADVRVLYEGLSTVAKDLTDAEDQYSKMKAKRGTSQSKAEQTQIHLAQAQSQWENQAPFVFSQFEAADNGRFLILKDSLARLQTLENDRAQTALNQTETVLDMLLTFDPQDEIRSYAERAANGEIEPLKTSHHHFPSGGSNAIASSLSHNKPKRMASGMSMNSSISQKPLPPSKSATMPGSSGGSGNASSSGGGSGGRLRSKVGSIFRKNKNKDRNQTITLSPTPSSGSSLSYTSSRDAPHANTSGGTPPSGRQQGGTPPGGRHPVGLTHTNGSGSRNGHRPLTHAATDPSFGTNGGGPLINKARNSDPSVNVSGSTSPSSPPGVDRSSKPRPPPSRKMQNEDAVNSANARGDRILTVDEEVEDNLPLRMTIRKDAIAEEENDADEALSNVASTLRARPTISSRRSRGRRDIHSRLFTGMGPSDIEQEAGLTPSSQDSSQIFGANGVGADEVAPEIPQQFQSQLQSFGQSSDRSPLPEQLSMPPQPLQDTNFQQPISPVVALPTGNSFYAASSAIQSPGAQSTTSLSSSSLALANRFPEFPSSYGVVAAISHDFYVVLRDGQAEFTKISGEALFAYRSSTGNNNPEEKVLVKIVQGAENVLVVPSVFSPAGADNTYTFNSLAFNGSLALKYTLPSSPSTTPADIIFTPIWRIEQSQSSLMLTYQLSPTCQQNEIIMNDLVIVVPVEGGKALSAQSKPMASFNREKQRMVWKIAEPTIVRRGEEGRFLCRFATQGPAREGASGIEIKFNCLSQRLPNLSFKYMTCPNMSSGSDPFTDQPNSSSTSLTNDASSWHDVETSVSAICRYAAHSERNVQTR